IRNSDLPLEMGDLLLSNSLSTAATEADIGTQRLYVSINYYYGYYFTTWMELMAVGEEAEIWVQTDLSWPEGDPRPTPVITSEQCEYLADEFDSVIYPLTTSYFGMPDYKEGWDSPYSHMVGAPPDYTYDPEGKSVVLVSNIRDDNYYDYTYPYFVIGVYSPTIEGWFDRNVVSLDGNNWQNYLAGPGGQYEGTLAHEYQHLIHDDYQAIKTPFMNEGCSMFAELLCGYPTAWNDINSFLATPDNSLTEWGDQGGINALADYGQALLWATYLVDNYGDEFLKNYVQNGITGVPGVEALLPAGVSFDDVYRDWTLANFMRTGYTRIDFNDKAANDVRVYEVKDKWPTDVYGTDFGDTITILGYNTGVSMVGSYGTDYILLSKLKWQYSSELWFNGEDTAWQPHWDKDGTAWYSGSSTSESALNLFFDFDATGVSALTFDTQYIIETGWDFGAIQISTDGGMTWTSLSNEYTTSDHQGTHPDIIPNLPGLTGRSDGWIPMSFELSAYSGPAIIRFRYMTDWGTEWDGWWIDNVALDGDLVEEGDFYTDYNPPLTSFIVSVLRQDFWDGDYYYNLIAEFDVSGPNEFVLDLANFLSSPGKDLRYPDVVLAITPRVGIADYSFSVVRT
ncbi:MAG: hypothetical protein ACFFA2_03880, partial [Promethearchaeota archaeon]